MSQHRRETDAGVGTRLVWALRRYRPLLALVALLTLAATVGAVAYTLQAPVEYSATSSVVASELEHEPAGLPRLAEAVGDEEEVLQTAIASGRLPYDTDEVREHVDLQPLEANVLVLVVATDTDPELAVRAANAVADSLAASLNDAGPGVGIFDVLNRATTAREVSKILPVVVLAAGGVLATIAAVLAVAGLALALKRPLTGPEATAGFAARDVLAVVDLGEALKGDQSAAFTGLASVLTERDTKRVVITAAAQSSHVRTFVAEGLVRALHPVTGAAFVPAVTGGQAAVERLRESEIPVIERGAIDAHTGPLVVDGLANELGGSTVALPAGTSALLLAVEGRGENSLLEALNRMPYSRVAGLVFLRARRRQVRQASRRPRQPRAARSRLTADD